MILLVKFLLTHLLFMLKTCLFNNLELDLGRRLVDQEHYVDKLVFVDKI